MPIRHFARPSLRFLGRLQLALVVVLGAAEVVNRDLARLHLGLLEFLLLTGFIALVWMSGRGAIALGRDSSGGTLGRRVVQGALTLVLFAPGVALLVMGEFSALPFTLLPALAQGCCLLLLAFAKPPATGPGPATSSAPHGLSIALDRTLAWTSGALALVGTAVIYPSGWADRLASNFPDAFVARWNAGDLEGLWRLQCCPKPGGFAGELLAQHGWSELPLIHGHSLERSPSGVPVRLVLELQESELVVELFANNSLDVTWLDFSERPASGAAASGAAAPGASASGPEAPAERDLEQE